MSQGTTSQSKNSSTSAASEAGSITPTINNNNNTTSYAPPVVYTPPQTQAIYTMMPVQPQITNQSQPQTNQNNSFQEQMAKKYLTNLEERAEENKTAAQNNNQKESNAVNAIQQDMLQNSQKDLKNLYENRKAEEQKQKDELEKLREENEKFKKEEDARKQKEELEKKFEDQESELKNKEKELDERKDELMLMEKNALINREEFDQDIEKLNKAKDTKEFGKELDSLYDQQVQMNMKEKEQKERLVSDLDREIYRDAGKLDKLNEKLNNMNARKNIFVKLIHFLTGHKDKESEKIKKEIQKLSEKMEENTMTIDKQREALKKIEEEGLRIMQERADDMGKNSKSQIDELKALRQQYNEITESKEYKKQHQEMYKNYINDMVLRHGKHLDLVQAMAEKRQEDIYAKYKLKDITLGRAKYNAETINAAKGNSLSIYN